MCSWTSYDVSKALSGVRNSGRPRKKWRGNVTEWNAEATKEKTVNPGVDWCERLLHLSGPNSARGRYGSSKQ